MSERTTTASWATAIVEAMELEGIDGRALFEELGMDFSTLGNPYGRFTQDSITRLWTRAVQLSGNPAIGMHMVRVLSPATFHVVGFSMMSSQTLAESFERMVRFQRILAEGAELSFSLLPEGYGLILRMHGDRLPPTRQSMEAPLAGALSMCRWLTGRSLKPVKVLLVGAEPRELDPYRKAFNAPLIFNATYHAIIFAREDMETQLPTANSAMAALHDRLADEYLAHVFDDRITHQARQVMCRLLAQGEARREAVARALHLSERTLQRRLRKEGSSFHVLLDCTRRELAQQYMAQPKISLIEAAYLLGFSDPSTFFRSFRRWFNATPREYRSRLLISQKHAAFERRNGDLDGSGMLTTGSL